MLAQPYVGTFTQIGVAKALVDMNGRDLLMLTDHERQSCVSAAAAEGDVEIIMISTNIRCWWNLVERIC